MSQGPNKLFDDFAKLMTDAAGAAQGVKEDVQTIFKTQTERLINEMDLVQREDFEALKQICESSVDKIDKLEKKLTALEEIIARNEK